MELYKATGCFKAVAPFDFGKSLQFLGGFGPMQGEHVIAANRLTKAVSIEGHPVVFQLTSVRTVEQPELEYNLFSGQPLTAAIQAATLDRARFFLSLEDDLGPFYAIGRTDPAFAPVIEALYGYHQVKFLTPFENACWAVLSQRNPMKMAQKMKWALTEQLGESLEVEGLLYRAFPEATQIIQTDPDLLHSLIRNERKAEQIASVAAAFSRADEEFLRKGDYAEVEAWLLKIKGIGAWSANFIMLRGLGRMERAPDSEKRLSEVLAHKYGQGHSLTPAEMRQVADRYGHWQGYWAHYLRVAG